MKYPESVVANLKEVLTELGIEFDKFKIAKGRCVDGSYSVKFGGLHLNETEIKMVTNMMSERDFDIIYTIHPDDNSYKSEYSGMRFRFIKRKISFLDSIKFY